MTCNQEKSKFNKSTETDPKWHLVLELVKKKNFNADVINMFKDFYK